ncbi:MAG: WYL domain-containing protein [Chthoniobacteraceae bacterium]|nr:WYL domain-containing protein [Chthoniobacteraceae bacterium]
MKPRANRRLPGADCGRSTLRRILFIHERLGHGRRADAASLARELEVSARTVKRDIEFMRDELGAPLEWEPSTRTYFYSRECPQLPLLRLEADEALALMLAGRTFSAWRGTPLGRALTAALGKIAGVVGGAISLPAAEISDLVFQPDEGPEADAETRFFAPALEAIRRRRELRIRYRKPGARADESRAIHPLHLAFLDHRWVLVAHDPVRRAPRNFLLARIRKAEPGAQFTPPAGFDLKAYLRGGLGRFTGGKETKVRLAFDATVAPYLRERPWHASQTIADLPGGEIEVTLRLNNLIDVQRRVLACGSHVEVLAPAELRRAIHAEAAAMATRHA